MTLHNINSIINSIGALSFIWLVECFYAVEGVVIIKEYPNVDACSAYLPKNDDNRRLQLPSSIGLIFLNSSTSFEECSNTAADWRDANNSEKRCRTACWLDRYDNNHQCVCLVDPIWMPKPENDRKVSSSRLIWPCRNDSDCSYNGHCDDNEQCQCDPAWKGPFCGELDLLPVDRNILGFRQVDVYGMNISSWGAPILWDEVSQQWHGFASEIQHHCGINAWETNSRIVHIISDDGPYGPYRKESVVFPAFSHEPSVVRGPNNEWVMLFSSYPLNNKSSIICKNCRGGVTPEISSKCPYQMGTPKELHHNFKQMMSISSSPFGPWSIPVEIPQLSAAWDWNTDLTIIRDGSAVALIRGGTTVIASNYSDPSTWKIIKKLQYPGWIGASVEDPYIWQRNGIYHALAHAFYPFFGVHAYAIAQNDQNPNNWTWTVTGVAYDNKVNFTDGTSHLYARRERPHLVWDGNSILALSNGVQYTGKLRMVNHDGVFTLIQPVRSTKSNNGLHHKIVSPQVEA